MKHKQTPSDKLGATVAPRRGAWVETCVLGFIGLDPLVAPRRGAWVETAKDIEEGKLSSCRTPQGCVG